MCDAWAVTTHQVTYEGPPSLAVRVATLLADAAGVELTSAERQQNPVGPGDTVLMALRLEGTTDDVTAAVAQVGDGLPPEASITIDSSTAGP